MVILEELFNQVQLCGVVHNLEFHDPLNCYVRLSSHLTVQICFGQRGTAGNKCACAKRDYLKHDLQEGSCLG